MTVEITPNTSEVTPEQAVAPEQLIIRAFQRAYDLYSGGFFQARQFAEFFRDTYTLKYPPSGPHLDIVAAEDLRLENADELLAAFDALDDETRQAVTAAVEPQLLRPVTVKPLFDRAAIFLSLACREPAPQQRITSFIAGHPLVEPHRYLLPLRGIAPDAGHFSLQSPHPTWWLQVLDQESGTPLVSLEFPR